MCKTCRAGAQCSAGFVDVSSVLDRMLRRNPLAAMAMHRPARSLSLQHLQLARDASAAPGAGEAQQLNVDQAEEAAEVLAETHFCRIRWHSVSIVVQTSSCPGGWMSCRCRRVSCD